MRTLAAILAGLLLVPAVASADDSVVVHSFSSSPQEVLDYWTPERIAAMPTGPSTPGTPPVDGPDGSGFAAGTAIDQTVGRLFFVERGEDVSCTATVVESRVAVTGGHCVHSFDLIGNDPQWMDMMLFVPGFRDGARPFGSYVVRSAVVHREWFRDDQNSSHDQAFLVLDRSAPVTQTLAYDQPGQLDAHQFGYPRAAGQPGHQGRPEFTGQRAAVCWGTPRENPGHPELPNVRGMEWGVACDMGGGSSGGPRFTDFDTRTGRGAVTGVNTSSFHLDAAGAYCEPGDPACTRHLGGPRFTRAITGPMFQRALSLG